MSRHAVKGTDTQEASSCSEDGMLHQERYRTEANKNTELSTGLYFQTSVRRKGTAAVVPESSPVGGSWVRNDWKVTPRVLFPPHSIPDQLPPHFGKQNTGVLAEAFDRPDENIFKQHNHVPQATYVSTLEQGPLELQPQELTPKPRLSTVERSLILSGDSCDDRNLACEFSRLTTASGGGPSFIHSSTEWNKDADYECRNLYRELMLEFE